MVPRLLGRRQHVSLKAVVSQCVCCKLWPRQPRIWHVLSGVEEDHQMTVLPFLNRTLASPHCWRSCRGRKHPPPTAAGRYSRAMIAGPPPGLAYTSVRSQRSKLIAESNIRPGGLLVVWEAGCILPQQRIVSGCNNGRSAQHRKRCGHACLHSALKHEAERMIKWNSCGLWVQSKCAPVQPALALVQ